MHYLKCIISKISFWKFGCLPFSLLHLKFRAGIFGLYVNPASPIQLKSRVTRRSSRDYARCWIWKKNYADIPKWGLAMKRSLRKNPRCLVHSSVATPVMNAFVNTCPLFNSSLGESTSTSPSTTGTMSSPVGVIRGNCITNNKINQSINLIGQRKYCFRRGRIGECTKQNTKFKMADHKPVVFTNLKWRHFGFPSRSLVFCFTCTYCFILHYTLNSSENSIIFNFQI